MSEKNHPLVSAIASSDEDWELQNAKSDDQVSTETLSPEAARRFERFTTLVDRFEKAASSGAFLPPVSASSGSR